jgi:ABC-2 type transport system ATP-binding protein
LRPDRGEVSLLGESQFTQALRYRVGFLPEESYLYSFLSIQETMDLAVKLYGNTPQLQERSRALLKAVRLDQVTQRKISECSKGMRRRVAFAQTLLHDPELIILDEPTSGFDPMGMVMMKDIIRELHAQGKTILICSHQLKEVQDLCQDIVILHRGETIAKGELLELVSERRWGLECASPADQLQVQALAQGMGLSLNPTVDVDLEKFFVELVASKLA